MMSEDEVGEIVAMLVVAYPNPAWEQAAVDLWCSCLVDLPVDATRAAVAAMVHGVEHQFRPPIATIRRAVWRLVDDLPSWDAGDAWGCAEWHWVGYGNFKVQPELCMCARDGRIAGKVVRHFKAVVHETIRRMGWHAFAAEESHMPFIRKEFIQTYDRVVEERDVAHVTSSGFVCGPPWSELEERERADVARRAALPPRDDLKLANETATLLSDEEAKAFLRRIGGREFKRLA